jgi:hypothetical protein
MSKATTPAAKKSAAPVEKVKKVEKPIEKTPEPALTADELIDEIAAVIPDAPGKLEFVNVVKTLVKQYAPEGLAKELDARGLTLGTSAKLGPHLDVVRVPGGVLYVYGNTSAFAPLSAQLVADIKQG